MFRAQTYREICSHGCHCIAEAGCLRCSKPLCHDHLPADSDQRCQECEATFSSHHPFYYASDNSESWGDVNLDPSPTAISIMMISGLLGLVALLSSMLIAIPGTGPVPSGPIGILLCAFASAMIVSFASMGMAFLRPAARVGAKTLRTLIAHHVWRRARRRFLNEYKVHIGS